MTLNEVLNLAKKNESINKINIFLANTEKNSYDFIKALSYKAIILATLNKVNESLKVLYEYIPEVKNMTNEASIALCDGIIEITLNNNIFDQALKYIELKKNFLPISKRNLYLKDKIEYYLKTKDLFNAKKELLSYLDDDISRDEMIYAKIKLADIYYELKQYDDVLLLLPDLKNHYETTLDFIELAKLTIKELTISKIKKNYNKIIHEGNLFIENTNVDMKYIIEIVSIMLDSYIELNDLKKASILESNYSEYISDKYVNESLDFIKISLVLYNKLNSLMSIKEYETKLIEFESLVAKPKKVHYKKSEDIIIPKVDIKEEEINEIKENNIIKVLNPEKEKDESLKLHEVIKDVNISKTYDLLSDVFNKLNQIDLDFKFREIFRQAAISICSVFPIDEIYILYFNDSYVGLHYKKERVYDKKVFIDNLENTINYETMIKGNELFLDTLNKEFNKNIVTNELYQNDIYSFSTPIFNSIECYGSIAYFSSYDFLNNEGVYESLKLISMMISSRLLLNLKNNEILKENQKFLFIKDNMSSGLKEIVDDYIHLSTRASLIYQSLSDLTLNDFYNNLESIDVSNYKNILDKLYNTLEENVILEYNYKLNDKIIHIKERFYPLKIDGTIHILSLIDDITNEYDYNKKLISIAYTNPISKLNTEFMLMKDLENSYKDKQLSLTVFSIFDSKIYEELYGFLFLKQLIFATGKAFNEIINKYLNIKLYHLYSDTFAILMEKINDRRSIDNRLNLFFDYVHNEIEKINSRVSIYFKAGVYRMSRSDNITDSRYILEYSKDALNNISNNDLSHIINHYDSLIMKRNFEKKNLITHISECIDHGSLVLNYTQVVNIKNVEVHGYKLNLGIDNLEIDDNLLNEVIKRRDLSIQMDKYLISNAFKEEKMLYDKCRGYINIFIKVNLDTLDSTFISFLETQINFFKIDPKYVTFEFETTNLDIINSIKKLGFLVSTNDLLDVIRENTHYYFYDIHLLSSLNISEINELCLKHKINCILTNVNTSDELMLVKETPIPLIYGKYYKKELRMKSIIEKLTKK